MAFSVNRCPVFLMAIVATGMFSVTLFAQQHRGSPKMLAADVVFLNDKTTFYGVINEVTDSTVTLVVERQWLKTHHKKYFDLHQNAESKAAEKAETELIDRIEHWINERPDDVNLVIFLEDEKLAATQRLANADFSDKRFTFLTFPRSDIRRVVLQKATQRQVALVAWQNDLPDVTTRTEEDLRTSLEKLSVDIESAAVDFADDIPGSPQSDHEWAMRKNIVEFVFLKSIEFQGMGDSFFRRGEKPGLKMLMTQLFGQSGFGGIQQIGEELGIPEFTRLEKPRADARPKDWWMKQARIADDEGFRSFSITRLEQDSQSPVVKVDVFFVGKNEEDEWILVKTFQGSANADRQSEEDVKALLDDPQVKKVVEMAEGFGLGAEAQLKKALRHGVATQSAMQQSLNRFAEFTNRFSHRLDSPSFQVDND